MAKIYDLITPELHTWISHQKMFFVATAPLAASSFLNCSPKGGDTFRILSDREVAYLDFTGSGVETIAHLRENGRIVVMFCAFDGPPNIVRLHGRGKVLYPEDAQFKQWISLFPPLPGARAIIHVTVSRISDSCGFSVPRYDFVAHRDVGEKWATQKGPDGLVAYRAQKNRTSIDGLPGYEPPPAISGQS